MTTVALVGMPGSGKSTVGRQLARRLGWQALDCDHEIERRIGCPIRVFFEQHGEAAFRDLEEQVVAELAGRPDTVLATGGGAVLREASRRALHARTHVVYLRSSPEDLFRRVRHDSRRPLLQVGDPMRRLRELHALRDPLYRETAHHVVETGRPTIAALVRTILMQLELSGIVAAMPSPPPPGPPTQALPPDDAGARP